MSSSAYLQLLSQTDTFRGVSTGVLQLALQTAHVRQIEHGQFLVGEGELATAFYVLTEGHAKMLRFTSDGHEILVKYIRPGQEVGVVAVLSGFEYPYAVQALDQCKALVWPGEVLAQLMERHTRLLFNLLRVMVKISLDLERRYEELLTEHVEQRVAQALLRLAEHMGRQDGECVLIDMPFPREDLA
jgi:CRP-like cAMP-binding protein